MKTMWHCEYTGSDAKPYMPLFVYALWLCDGGMLLKTCPSSTCISKQAMLWVWVWVWVLTNLHKGLFALIDQIQIRPRKLGKEKPYCESTQEEVLLSL